MERNLNNKLIFNTREVIEIQSAIYYSNNKDLGFNSLANSIKEYPEVLFKIIDRILSIHKKQIIEIIELGPGTLFFAQRLVYLLRENGYEVKYTVVDLNATIEQLCKELNITFCCSSFEKFCKTNKKRFDFLIMNQSLDMWAGSNFLNHKNTKYTICWKLYDTLEQRFLSYKDMTKINNKNDFKNIYWIKYYRTRKNNISSLKYFPNEIELINLPYSLFYLVQKIQFGGFIQDYWNFNSNVALRTGLSAQDCSNLLTTFPLNIQRSIIEKNHIAISNISQLLSVIKNQEADLINWFESNIIPFGSRDVTYSPQIFRIASLLAKSGFNYEVLTIKKLIDKLLPELENNVNENQFGSEKNILLFERKYLEGLSF